MQTVSLTVNGAPVSAAVAPHAHLADFLREELLLTGTHIGCEHGVCGACTVMLDGAPVRSCLTFAVACEGRAVRTVEGYDEDSLMAELRAAFKAEHALQCGYCTPGMLATAHDIVSRLPDADEARIRDELAGNLCRCTGYVGIVRAIRGVLAARAPRAEDAPAKESAGPAIKVTGPPPPAAASATAAAPADDQATRVGQQFTVPFPRARVWELFGDPAAVAECMPGAELDRASADGRLAGRIAVSLGPIRAAFAGEAEHRRDDEACAGSIAGGGGDRRSGSGASGVVRYRLHETDEGAGTCVEVALAFTLTGPLAQFARSGLLQDIADRMTAEFARNLARRLSGETVTAAGAELSAGRLLWSVIRERIARLFRSTGSGDGKSAR